MEYVSQLRPGDRLPSRPALCARFDTTRTTLDKAVGELVGEGLLFARNGSGTYVRGLADARSRSVIHIAVVIPNNLRKTYRMLISSLESKLSGRDVNFILCTTDDDPEKQRQHIGRLVQSGVSGFAIVPAVVTDYRKNYRYYSPLLDMKIPFVFCYRGMDDVDAPLITSNNFYGGYLAGRHLISRGYRHIAYVASRKFRSSIERYQGLVAALTEAGAPVDLSMMALCGPWDASNPEGYLAARRILRSGRPVDAFFCYNDRIAQGVRGAILEEGLVISDQIGLIGYENEETCLAVDPRLTSVSMQNEEIGRKAAEVLWRMIHKEPVEKLAPYVFQPELIDRASCLGVTRGWAHCPLPEAQQG